MAIRILKLSGKYIYSPPLPQPATFFLPCFPTVKSVQKHTENFSSMTLSVPRFSVRRILFSCRFLHGRVHQFNIRTWNVFKTNHVVSHLSWVFDTNSNLQIPIPDVENLWYFKLKLFDMSITIHILKCLRSKTSGCKD